MFKVKVECAPDIMKEIFEIDNRDDFRDDFLIKRCIIRSVYYGTETASLLAQKYETLYLTAAKMQPH